MRKSASQAWYGVSYDLTRDETIRVRSFLSRNKLPSRRLVGTLHTEYYSSQESCNHRNTEGSLGSITTFDTLASTRHRYSRVDIRKDLSDKSKKSVLEQFVEKNFNLYN